VCVAAPVDAGFDAREPEVDAGSDAGETDAGLDAGETDAGFEAGVADAGSDAGVDAGPCRSGEPCCTPDREGMPCGAPTGGVTPGTCFEGACCTGCILAGGFFGRTSCEPGTEPAACGRPGSDCVICADRDICTAEGTCSGPSAGM
jgi:hypothetical protein